jgi:hypothetical protein
MARVMIHSKNLAQHFWGEAVNTACHIINKVYLRPETNKTPYKIWRGKKPTVVHHHTLEKLLILHVILSTSELLEVNAIFFVIGRILKNLIQKMIKVYS